MSAATPAEIAGAAPPLSLMATSIFFLDLAHHPDLHRHRPAPGVNAWRSVGAGVVLLLGVNWLIVAPAVRADPATTSRGEAPFEASSAA